MTGGEMVFSTNQPTTPCGVCFYFRIPYLPLSRAAPLGDLNRLSELLPLYAAR